MFWVTICFRWKTCFFLFAFTDQKKKGQFGTHLKNSRKDQLDAGGQAISWPGTYDKSNEDKYLHC